MRLRKYALVLPALITCVLFAKAQDRKSKLDSYFEALHRNQQYSGTVLVALPSATSRARISPGSALSTEPKLNSATTKEAAIVNPCMRSVGR